MLATMRATPDLRQAGAVGEQREADQRGQRGWSAETMLARRVRGCESGNEHDHARHGFRTNGGSETEGGGPDVDGEVLSTGCRHGQGERGTVMTKANKPRGLVCSS